MIDVSFLRDLPSAVRFLTRIPLPHFAFERIAPDAPPDIDRMGPALPLVGALVGLIGAIVLLTALTIHLGGLVSATLAVAVMAAITGAFHEDGLADTADGLGGMTRGRRLEIMKDSRVGSFGAIALIVAILLRVGALEGLSGAGLWSAAAALVAASGLARLGGLWVLHALPPARPAGLSDAAGRPTLETVLHAALLAFLIAGALVIPTSGLVAFAVALVLAGLAILGIKRLAQSQFGGQTGDVAGAATQAAEIAFLLGLLIFARQF